MSCKGSVRHESRMIKTGQEILLRVGQARRDGDTAEAEQSIAELTDSEMRPAAQISYNLCEIWIELMRQDGGARCVARAVFLRSLEEDAKCQPQARQNGGAALKHLRDPCRRTSLSTTMPNLRDKWHLPLAFFAAPSLCTGAPEFIA